MTRTPLRRATTRLALLGTAAVILLSLSHAIAEGPNPTVLPAAQTPTDNAQLDRWLRVILNHPDQIVGGNGAWRFTYADEPVVMMTDPQANRMRIMAPIGPAADLDPDELPVLLAANFDRALDARYCVGQGLLWSAFIHPLGDLSAQSFADALNQVVTLKKTYGTTYSSTGVRFGPPHPPDPPAKPGNPDHAI